MKNVNFIIPYFGKLPALFPIFLKSCEYNYNFNWTLFTDDKTNYSFPKNFQVVYTTFENIKKHIQDKFDFNIEIKTPYKFCDLKPMYGYLFPEYNEGYKFWGYCDIDIVLGNLSNFITEEILEKYDKIYTLGHMTLIRNTGELNSKFKDKINNVEYYKEVLANNAPYNFDEDFRGKININTIFRNANKEIFIDDSIADIYTKGNHFYLDKGDGKTEKNKMDLFIWYKGALFGYQKINNCLIKKEFRYIHLQKRAMNIKLNDIENTDCIKIIPNEISELEINFKNVEDSYKKIKKYNINLQYFRIRLNNLKIKLKNIKRKY